MSDESKAAPVDPARPATPELDKLVAVTAESQKLGEFLEWLEQDARLVLARVTDRDELVPASEDINMLLARYFGIDLMQVEQERRAILAYLRKEGED